ncbi:DUF484 family protein [Aurantivibrio plasticivorans]
MSNKPDLTVQQVSEFLREKPDFFADNPDILADITLPHHSGDAISLVERQVAVLRDRNMDMRHRLTKLLDNARENDKLFDKTRRLILMLLEGNSLPDIVSTICFSFDRDFNIPYTSVILFADPSKVPESSARIVSVNDARQSVSRLISNSRALCGDFPPNELTFLFQDKAKDIGSAAVVPLMHGNCFGLLAIGNSDPNHYRSSMGTLFLSYIGEVLNRVIPKHLTF